MDREPSIADVDRYISAELPDPSADPLGFSLVREFMVYGPCGSANLNSPCMRDGKCSKRYPKPFRSETAFDDHYTGAEKMVFLPGKGMYKSTINGLCHIICQYSRNTRHILMLRPVTKPI